MSAGKSMQALLMVPGKLRPKGGKSEEGEAEDGPLMGDKRAVAKDLMAALKSGDVDAVVAALDAAHLLCSDEREDE